VPRKKSTRKKVASKKAVKRVLPKIEKDVKTLSDGLSYSFNNFRRIWNFY